MVALRRARARRPATALMCVTVLICAGAGGSARAFDFFGLFGRDSVPEPSGSALPYELSFEVRGDGDVESLLRQASNLDKLRRDAPPDGDTLVQRVRADFPPLIDALWSAGYYNARVTVTVAGVALEIGADPGERAARAANALRGRARVPVVVVAETGPLFTLRSLATLDARTGLPLPESELPLRVLRLKPGDPARAVDLRAAIVRIVDHYRRASYPLVKAPLPAPVVDHAALVVDVAFAVDPGPKAGFGEVAIKGPQLFPQAVVRSFVYLEPGQPYSPKALDDTRRSVATIPAVGSVRIREGDRLDANGRLPIFLEVTDRAPNLVGYSAGFSTTDGPTGRLYYEHRNLFGEAERLRLEGSAFFAPRNDGSRIREIGDFKTSDIGARFTTSFLKPALGGSRVDFLFDGVVERNRTGGGRFGGYTGRLGGVTPALRFRVDETLAASAGVKYEQGKFSDVISSISYRLVGVPLGLTFDNTDKLLDPSTGVRVRATVTPYPTAFGSSVGFTRATGDASTYLALDENADYILAGRIGLGGFLDGPARLEDLPANYRFYAGGGGSVRGYRYQSIGPRGPFGFTVGGRSLFEANLEARLKVTDTIGIVPFFDIGGAYAEQYPDFRGDTRMAAGLGLRYYTGIGPIRLDVAVPVNPRRGDKDFALYVSIGQSF